MTTGDAHRQFHSVLQSEHSTCHLRKGDKAGLGTPPQSIPNNRSVWCRQQEGLPGDGRPRGRPKGHLRGP
eukprot:8526558-Alexandrium_andersonii.AAC.1